MEFNQKEIVKKFNSINLIESISKYLYILTLAISVIIVCTLTYILFGGSIEGQINISTMIDQNGKIMEYSNFNQIPFYQKLIVYLCITITLFFIIVILKYWRKFMSLVKDGKYFEINTIKNLKYISYLLISIWIVLLTLEFFTDFSILTSFIINEQLESKEMVHDMKNLNFESDIGYISPPSISILIIAMILWILSHVLNAGIKIKKENDLTI